MLARDLGERRKGFQLVTSHRSLPGVPSYQVASHPFGSDRRTLTPSAIRSVGCEAGASSVWRLDEDRVHGDT